MSNNALAVPKAVFQIPRRLPVSRAPRDTVIEMDPIQKESESAVPGPTRSKPNNNNNNLQKDTQAQHSTGPSWVQQYRVWRENRFKGRDGRLQGIRYEHIESYPKGYPRLAAYLASDPNFLVYRRFGTLRNRLLLFRQQELVRLEKELRTMDEEDDVEGQRYRIQSTPKGRDTKEQRRTDLMDEIDKKLKQYDELLARERASMSMAKPTERNHLSLLHYLWNRRPIVRSEADYINQVDDFVILTEDQDTLFQVFLENMIAMFPSRWFRNLFSTNAQRARTKDSSVHLVSKERINNLVKAILSLVIIALLLLPVYLLSLCDLSDRNKFNVLLTFMLMFAGAILLFGNRARSHEIFTAIATYSAVLVVFLSNLITWPQPSPSA